MLQLYAGDGSIFASPPMRIRDNQLSEEEEAELEKRLEQAKKENEKVLAQKVGLYAFSKEGNLILWTLFTSQGAAIC